MTYGRLSMWFVMQCDVSSGARFKFAGWSSLKRDARNERRRQTPEHFPVPASIVRSVVWRVEHSRTKLHDRATGNIRSCFCCKVLWSRTQDRRGVVNGRIRQLWSSGLSTRHQIWQCGFDSRSGRTEDLKNDICDLSSLELGVDGWVQGNSSRTVLSLPRHQYSIHCETSHGASKRRWSPQTTRDTPKGAQKRFSMNEN